MDDLIRVLARRGAEVRLKELEAEAAAIRRFLSGRTTVAPAGVVPVEEVAKAKRKAKRKKRTISPEGKAKLAVNLEKARAVLAAKKRAK
jgi:hypothetical protein